MSQVPQEPVAAYQPTQPMSEKAQPQVSMANPPSRLAPKWTFGLFDCFSPLDTCCLGCWCPCIVYGKTYSRNNGETDPSGFSGMCCLWLLTAHFGFASCLQCVTRGGTRERIGIEGNAFGDCCTTFWCPHCSIIQEEKESIVRQTGIDPKTKMTYQPVSQEMKYPA